MNMKYRSKEVEIMDDFSLNTDELKVSLDKIAWINQILGGNTAVMKAIKNTLINKQPKQVTSIVDIGCGNGDMLRTVAAIARKEGFNVKLHGIDANDCTIQYGQQLSEAYPEISYSCQDILAPGFKMEDYDIVLFTLTLHHFSDEEIVNLIRQANQHARLGIIVNDLHRSKISYILFGWLSVVFRLGRMNINDGKISIMRGFKRKELQQFSQMLQLKSYTIQWKWAFRYQWIIYKL